MSTKVSWLITLMRLILKGLLPDSYIMYILKKVAPMILVLCRVSTKVECLILILNRFSKKSVWLIPFIRLILRINVLDF